MHFSDLFTSNILSSMTAATPLDMFLCIVLSFMLGLFIFYVYKHTFKGVMFSSSFGLTLIGLCMVASMLILAVSSNIVLSLGMVGALSIVRFRSAIKEPLDIVFLFWSIAAGIILAVGMIPLAIFGSIAIGIMLIGFANHSSKTQPYILILNLSSSEVETSVMELIRHSTEKQLLKGKTFNKSGAEELTIEISLKNGESDFVRQLNDIAGVENVAMVSYNGDYMS